MALHKILVPLSISLILVTHLVITEVLGFELGIVTAGFVGVLIGLNWWFLPILNKKNQKDLKPSALSSRAERVFDRS